MLHQITFYHYQLIPTYQIAEHYLTQTAFENPSVLRRDTVKSPWFPGICILNREEAFEDFAYLCKVAKR